MNAPSQHLARLIDSQYDELIERWALRAAARTGKTPELGECLPALLRGLIDGLSLPEPEAAPPASLLAEGPRIFEQPFDLEAVVYEYGLLQRIVLELLEMASVPVSMGDVRRLGDWFTRAVARAAVEHAKVGGGGVSRDAADTQRSAGQGSQRFAERARTGVRAGSSAVTGARGRLDEQTLMQAPVALSLLSGPDFVYEFANPLALAMVGHRDVIGKTVREAFPELGEEAPVLQVLRQVYASGESYDADEYVVPLARGEDGALEDVYFKFTCQPIRDTEGRVRDILTVAADVSSQVHARQHIEALMQEVKLAERRKDEWLAMLAHELRNPIAAISTALGLLERANADAGKAARYRETARRQMHTLVRLVDDLLDVARITHAQVELHREPADFAAIVQDALGATRPVLEARAHELSVTLTSGAFRVFADAIRLQQVVVNLLTNAAKYTDPGGKIAVRLAREETSEGPVAVLAVRDTGRGIPAEMLDSVFEPFTQVSPALDRKSGGLGLGLTLVKHLTEMHGGSVTVHSAGPGQGSEFCVRVPLRVEPSSEIKEAEPPPRSPRAERRRVVLVEDSDDVRELLEECIEQLGHEVLVAADGLAGVELIGRSRPALALIDVGLPGIDGYEVARRVRATPGCGAICLIALTGYGGADVAHAAQTAGFDRHVTKPIGIDQLREMLAGVE